NAMISVVVGSARPESFASPPASQDEASQLTGVRVLVAEDNPVNRELVHHMLAQLGADSLMATNGFEALDVLTRDSVDLVLMDCQMPELDGYQATKRLREIESRAGQSRVPVIALTANALAGDRERCLTAGMDDYLPKPFTRKELLALVRRWVDRESSASDRRGAATRTAPGITSVIGARAGSPALDPAVLASLRSLDSEGGDTLVARLARLFREDAQLRREQLRRAYDESNAELLRSAAHAFKSSSANMGARALAELCRKIETQTLGGEIPDSCAGLLVELEHEHARVDDCVSQILATADAAVEHSAA
ncbi:MAG TPA: response regulator, partial [Casimicrobiaceae bacterium]|nr:response regulator [Casimicrobiaceae bacterium]